MMKKRPENALRTHLRPWEVKRIIFKKNKGPRAQKNNKK